MMNGGARRETLNFLIANEEKIFRVDATGRKMKTAPEKSVRSASPIVPFPPRRRPALMLVSIAMFANRVGQNAGAGADRRLPCAENQSKMRDDGGLRYESANSERPNKET